MASSQQKLATSDLGLAEFETQERSTSKNGERCALLEFFTSGKSIHYGRKMCIHDLEGEDYKSIIYFLKKNNTITGLEKHIPHTIC
jgi:hypothetical protein